MDNPVLRQVLLGCYDSSSPLHRLRGNNDVLKIILSKLVHSWVTPDESSCGVMQFDAAMQCQTLCGKHQRGMVEFPEPLRYGRKAFEVTMMPIIIGDKESLPPSCRRYHDMIRKCAFANAGHERGMVGYLSIFEGHARKEPSNGRLHVLPGRGRGVHVTAHDGASHLHGGIFFAANTSKSLRIYDIVVDEGVASMGDIEFLRPAFTMRNVRVVTPEANELVWMTDQTPREILPMTSPSAAHGIIQTFSLVTSNIAVWDADKWTKNPVGVKPTVPIVRNGRVVPPKATISLESDVHDDDVKAAELSRGTSAKERRRRKKTG